MHIPFSATSMNCAVNECDREARTRGWCQMHYKRWLKHGDPEYRRPTTCSIKGCDKSHCGRGLCRAHLRRQRIYGDPLAGGPSPAPRGEPERFYREVVLTYDGDECLIWPYSTVRGYPQILLDGQSHIVSRLACAEANGPPPTPRHHAAHNCGRGRIGCVTKRHLSWKTPAENNADKVLHGTQQRGEQVPSSKLTEEQVREILALKDQMTRQAIADQFSVAPSTVSEILCRKSWAWIEEAV